MYNLVFLGPPGAGKGTQASIVAKEHGLAHIASGSILRREIAAKTKNGKIAKEYMDRGMLVPDNIIIDMITEILGELKPEQGFILDGFPRTTSQAIALDSRLLWMDRELTATINIHVDSEVIIERVSSRRICIKCEEPYNLKFKAPKVEGICDLCGGELYQRSDEHAESVAHRLEAYEEKTFPLIEYYRERKLLYTVNGDQDIDLVSSYIETILGELK